MGWPGVSDYQDAVQSPRHCFADPELQAGSPVLTRLGLPRPISGGNASVYQFRSGRAEFAVRCFLRDVPELRQRYAAIGAHLEQARLPATVGFEYLAEGIRVRGTFRPVLKMQWVRGVPLNDYVRQHLGDRAALLRLAESWQQLIGELGRAGIAHGDLQHGNVLIAEDRLVLIDYDGMFVPALQGQPGLEIGHPAFQHPARQAQHFGPEIDRFAALAIHVAILVLAARPELWQRFDNSDNLLFGRDDFADPAASALFAELERLPEGDLAARVRALRQAAIGPIEAVPDLRQAVAVGRQRHADRAALSVALSAASPTAVPTAAPAAVEAVGARRDSAGGGGGWLAGLMATASGDGGPALLRQWRSSLVVSGLAALPAAVAAASMPVGDGDRRRRERRLLLAIAVVLVQAAVLAFSSSLWWVVPAVALASWSGRARRSHAGAGASAGATAAPPSLCFSPSGRLLAVAAGAVGSARNARALQSADGSPRATSAAQDAPILGVVAAGDARFAIITVDGAIATFERGQCIETSLVARRPRCVAGSRDGQLFAVGTMGRTLELFGADLRRRGSLRAGAPVTAAAFAPDGAHVVVGGDDGVVRMLCAATGAPAGELARLLAPVVAIGCSDSGRFVAAASGGGRLAIWDARRRRSMWQCDLETGALALAFAAAGATLLVGCADGSIRGFDVVSGGVVFTVAAHQAPVCGLAVAGDGRCVASVDTAGQVAGWSHAAAPRRAPSGRPQPVRP